MATESTDDLIVNWYVAYDKLAKELYAFGMENKGNEGKKLFNLCYNNDPFLKENEWLQNFEKYDQVLDPIHLFANINNGSQSQAKRTKLVNVTIKLFDKEHKDYPPIIFSGCPTPPVIRIRSVRKEPSVSEIWATFFSAYEKKKDGISQSDFNKLKEWYGIDIVSFSIFMFWIDSKNFLPLDKNTLSLLKVSKRVKGLPKDYSQYLALLDSPDSDVYRNLALSAINSDEISKLKPKDKEDFEIYTGSTVGNQFKNKVEERRDFRIIAISALEKCSERYRKVLNKNHIYHFYDDYVVNPSRNEIKFNKNGGQNLYSFKNGDIQLNISAIVGKNGTGKSTITELLLAIINNLSLEALGQGYIKDPELKKIDGLHAQLFFKTTFVYMLSIEDDVIGLYRYESENSIDYIRFPEKEETLNLEDFFYNVFINYSQYGLNCTYEGKDWLDPIFRKNDSYQMPLVLEPFREDGIIDINVQDDLLKNRLLANILSPEFHEEYASKFLHLTESRQAEQVVFKLNKKKIDTLFEEDKISFTFAEFADQNYWSILAKSFGSELIKIDFTPEDSLLAAAKKYVEKKLVSIASTYLLYEDYINPKTGQFLEFEDYVKELAGDKSHITHKLRQAINFIRYPIVVVNTPYSIKELSNSIKERMDSLSDEKQETIFLIPPSFLSYNLYLTDGVDFDELSSGEKQKIFSVNSLLYQLRNINSVSIDKDLQTYNCVNIVLDEVELYFHPEIQRTYIEYLWQSIQSLNLDRIIAINLIFVTHSPFILSDIPSTNILFLPAKKDELKTEKVKTFGANIHELLTDGFFMEFTIGAFAKLKIERIINYHLKLNEDILNNAEELKALKADYNSLREEFYFIVNNIGEEYLKNILENHLKEIERRLQDSTFIRTKIEALKKEIELLNNSANESN